MVSNYTCTACARALARSSSSALQRTTRLSLRQAQRTFSTTTPGFYHASQRLSAPERIDLRKPRSESSSAAAGVARKLREAAPGMTETYVAYGATQELIKACTAPGDYKIPQALAKNGEIPTDENGVHLGVAEGWWYDTLGLQPNFSNWAQITFIHMYMLQVRFRMFPKTHAPVWIQHITNHAFYAAEDRLVVWHKFNANSLRQKHLKSMFSNWRAVLLSYDEGLMKGDAVLATAIWRNLLSAREDVDFEKLAQIVGYMRRELKRLENAPDDFVANGQWRFSGDPGEEIGVVKAPSRLIAMEGR